MANRPAKTIKFPGLEHTYTFLQDDTTLSVAGEAADAKATGDALAAVQTQVDGVQAGQYPDMGAGQLLSTTGTVNPTPYTYRENASGSDRVTVQQITGGTVAFNQLVVDDDIAEWTDKGITSSRTGGRFTVTGTGTTTGWHNVINLRPTAISDHIYLLLLSDDLTETDGVQFGYFTSWLPITTTSRIRKCTQTTQALNFQIRVVENHSWNNSFYLGFFDLTQMFGATVAQYFLDLETATPGAGVALFRTMFPENYYPYNAGELVSVQTSAHKMTGKNLAESTARIPVTIQGVKWDVASDGTVIADRVSSSSNVSDLTYMQAVMPAGHYVFHRFSSGSRASGSTYQANIVIGTENHWGTSDYSFELTENTQIKVILRVYSSYSGSAVFEPMICFSDAPSGFEPYKAWSYPLDSTLTLRGIPVLTDGKITYDGDQYAPNGAVTRRYGIVDLGSRNWGIFQSTAGIFRASIPDYRTALGNDSPDFICESAKYTPINTTNSAGIAAMADKTICHQHDTTFIIIKDSEYGSDYSSFKTSLSGVYLVYELATPTTETAAPYQSIQIAGSTEEFLPPATDTRAAAVPVGSVSLYQTNLRAGLEKVLGTLNGADPAHAESIAPVQGGTASNNIAEGELLMRDGKLYTATQAIVAGAEIGATNTTATTIAAQLAVLAARIAALEN